MKKLLCCLAVVAAVSVTAGQAAAAIIVATFTGTVLSGTDTAGVFGAAGGDLAGQAFTATYTYDTGAGAIRTTTPGFADELRGGSLYGAPTPIVSAILSIGGQSDSFQGLYNGRISTFAGGEFRAEAHQTIVPVSQLYTYLVTGAPSSIEGPTTFAGLGFGYVQRDGGAGYYANLSPNSVSILGSAVPVPEPATWATMILGFFGLGAALRRRRAMAPVVA